MSRSNRRKAARKGNPKKDKSTPKIPGSAYIDDTYLDGESKKEESLDGEIREFYTMFRNGKIDHRIFIYSKSPENTDKLFNLKGLMFGKWTTKEDRVNYLCLTYLCFMDINKVLKFKDHNLGLSKTLALSFGARGQGSALAHFEPWSNVINITRYWRNDKLIRFMKFLGMSIPDDAYIEKRDRFLETGGAGSFAHEYGHFLDYNFGRYIEPSKGANWLTGASRTTAMKIKEPKKAHKMRRLTKKLMDKILLDKDGKPSRYKNRIKSKGDYLNYRVEVFARAFEQYIAYKLKKLNIKNKFLTDPVYKRYYYLTPQELEPVIPLFDDLVKEMRKHV